MAVRGKRSRTARAAGPISSRTTASTSRPLRSGWLFAAPIEPTIWSTPTPSAVSSTVARGVGCMPVTVGRDPCRLVTHWTYPVLRCREYAPASDRGRPPASRRRSPSRALPRRRATSCASGRRPRARRASPRRAAAGPRRRSRSPAPCGAHHVETTEQQHERRQDARDEDRAAVGHGPLELGPTDGLRRSNALAEHLGEEVRDPGRDPDTRDDLPAVADGHLGHANHAQRREHERAAVGRSAHELCEPLARDVVDCSEEPACARRRHASTT